MRGKGNNNNNQHHNQNNNHQQQHNNNNRSDNNNRSADNSDRSSSVVLSQLYFEAGKWSQHRGDNQAALVAAKDIVVLCAEVSFTNLEPFARCIEQHRPAFICTRSINRPLYEAVCGLSAIRNSYVVCQHNAPTQCVFFWHYSINVDFVSMRQHPVVSTALTIRQVRGSRTCLTVLCAAPSGHGNNNTPKGIADILHDIPHQGNQPSAVMAIVPRGQDIKNIAHHADYAAIWGSSESPFQIVVKGSIGADHVMGLPADCCSAVVATMVLLNGGNQKGNRHRELPPPPWHVDHTIILPSTLTPPELIFDVSGSAPNGLAEAVDGLNTNRIVWPHDYAVVIGHGKGETFPAFVLVSTRGQCDIASFHAYVARVNFARVKVTLPEAKRWSAAMSIPLATLTPVDAVYDLSGVLPTSIIPYTLAQVVSKLNAFEVEWKRDFAIVHVADGDTYVLLAASNVPCDIAAARYDAVVAMAAAATTSKQPTEAQKSLN